MAVSCAHTEQPQAVERPLQRVLADRLIDNVYAFSVRNLAGGSYEVFARIIDDVVTTEISGPGTKDMAHAASSRMDQNIISRLHLMRSMQEILCGHSLQD